MKFFTERFYCFGHGNGFGYYYSSGGGYGHGDAYGDWEGNGYGAVYSYGQTNNTINLDIFDLLISRRPYPYELIIY